MKISVPPEIVKGVKSELKDIDLLKDFSPSEKVKVLSFLSISNKEKIEKLQKTNVYLWLVIFLNCLAILILTITK